MELLLSLARKELSSLCLLLSSRPEANIQKALKPLVIYTVDIGVQHLDEDISLCIQEYLENSPRWKRMNDTNKRNLEGWLVHEADGKYVDLVT